MSEHVGQGQMVRALAQGLLLGFCGDRLREHLALDHLEQPIDERGDYERHFVIHTRAGHRIRVQVELEGD